MVNNTQNTIAYVISALGVIALVAFGVSAYGTTTPSNFGHTITDEIGSPAGCQSGQVLQWTGSSWTCVNFPLSGATGYIPMYTSPTSIGNSAIYETSNFIGIGKTNPRSRLDVQGNIIATGTICSDSGGCIGSSSTSGLSQEYTLTGGNAPLNLGSRFFCFLVHFSYADASRADLDCDLGVNNGVWTFAIGGNSTSMNTCKARCYN